MLTYPSTESLLPRAENRYVLAMLTARRARQLTAGARPAIASDTPNNVTLASEEIGEGAIAYRYGKLDIVIPEHPAIIAEREAAQREARAKEEEERLEEQSRVTRHVERRQEENVFESAGISAQDASLIAERLISHVEQLEKEERLAAEEDGDDAVDTEEA
ncbi:MAG: DNA-directed RNA polymerase subunit omega [Saccharofermentanales bacterium]|jgi:DNA-directed RNA polymerase subunit omega